VQHLIDADACERLTALVLAAQRPPLRLHDVNKAQATLRLQQLSEEVGRIASLLSALSEDEAAAAAMAGLESHDGDPQRLEAGQIRAMIRARRMRDHFFKRDLFADPAWDMLLDLMAARLEKQQVAVSSLCIAAAVPPTTALRWIKALCDQGLFVRVADPEDGRRVFIDLSEQAAAALESYLKAVQRITPFVL
jgi:DNA-binding MarR family transcriptional regulator